MGKKCEVCKKRCTGDIIKAEDGKKYFHVECFTCKACQLPLSGIGYYTTTDGGIVCPDHYRAISTPLSIRAEGPRGFAQSDLPQPPLGSPTTCAECGDHLSSGQVLLALGQSWHVWCFKCSECAAVLQGEYMVHNGKPLCLRDYNHKHGVKCYECERFIAGRVLEAGGYKFHPTCARCSRCGNHFGDGQEMYMQGNEIWHPQCEHYRTTENLAYSNARPRDGAPKYESHLGQHLIYMYLLPETEQTNLKHAIAPRPAQLAQFHTPQGPVKIRKSRMAMLKTGMQRLTEDLEKNTPRAHSPHMDNEEPIEMAHYPNAQQPDPGEIPPIEREDFPAPPYPYAVEELKRRLSSSSVENDDDETDDDLSLSGPPPRSEEKVKKTVEALHNIDKDSSIAHVFKQNLEEAQKKQRLPLHWDPRNASRTPSAKKMPHLKFRYDTPINASPSRHLNRPKPWVFWQGDSGVDRAATTALPCFHIPQSRDGTARGAVTLPDGYYYDNGGTFNGTLSTHYSDHSLNAYSTLPSQQTNGKDFRVGGDMRTTLRTSLPDMSKPVKTYPLGQLQTTNANLPEDADRQHLERHLAREEFEALFEMTPIEFYKLPEWKRINMKRKAKLF